MVRWLSPSQPESKVLGYLAELLTPKEIAVAMSVSVGTVRGDTLSPMRKLVHRNNDTGQPHLRIVSPDTSGEVAP